VGTGATWQRARPTTATRGHVSMPAFELELRLVRARAHGGGHQRASLDSTCPSLPRVEAALPAPMATAGSIKAAQGGSDAPLCLKVRAPACSCCTAAYACPAQVLSLAQVDGKKRYRHERPPVACARYKF